MCVSQWELENDAVLPVIPGDEDDLQPVEAGRFALAGAD